MIDADGLNVTEAAAYLGFSRTTVYALLKQGTIPHVLVGSQPRFSRTALTIWLGGRPLVGILAGVAALARGAPTGAPTATPTRLTPKHIGGRQPRRPTPTPLIPRSGATARDRS